MKLLNRDHSVLMEVHEMRRENSQLVIRGAIMGAMPVEAVLTPTEVRAALRQIGFFRLLFLISMLFRS